MKYIITESQNERIKKLIEKFLNNGFKDFKFICNIIVEDSDDYGCKYKIIINLNQKLMNKHSLTPINIYNKIIDEIIEKLSGYMNLEYTNDYTVNCLIMNC